MLCGKPAVLVARCLKILSVKQSRLFNHYFNPDTYKVCGRLPHLLRITWHRPLPPVLSRENDSSPSQLILDNGVSWQKENNSNSTNIRVVK